MSTGPDSLDVREEDQAALRWLEENPPDSVAIPALQINIAYPVAYRDDGTIKRSRASASIKKLAKSPGGGTAVDGRFAWIWTEPPPPEICGALAELCPDVAYLGTTESPARLRAVTGDEIEATADLDATAGMFSTAVTALVRPVRGRTAELMAAHQDATGRPPSVAADKVKTDEKSLSPVPRRAAVATARYRDRARPAVRGSVAARDRAAAGPGDRGGVPGRLGGRGAPGAGPPDRLRRAATGHRRLPAGNAQAREPGRRCTSWARRPPRRRSGSATRRAVPGPLCCCSCPMVRMPVTWTRSTAAVAGLSSLRGPGGRTARIDQAAARELPGGEFWQPPAPGRERVWETRPAAIPDTRGNQGWTFADAALLSLAFVWKDTWTDRLPRTAEPGRPVLPGPR